MTKRDARALWKALEEQAHLDESRPVIEYYRRRDEVDILVPIV